MALSSRAVDFSVRTTPLTWGSHASVTSMILIVVALAYLSNCYFLNPFHDLHLIEQPAKIERRGNAAAPVHEAQLAFKGFHQGSEALDPIAVIAVEDAVNFAQLGLVDMAADHA